MKTLFKHIPNCGNLGFILAALFLPVSALHAQATLAVAPGTDLATLLKNGPTVITSSVVTTDDKWVKLVTDTHAVSDVSIDKVYAVLTDLKNQPNVFKGTFSRTKSVEIISATDEGTTATFTTTAKIGPIQVDTTYTALVKERPNLPASFSKIITQTAPNDKIRAVSATWYAESVTIADKPYTYIRFYDSNEVNQNSNKLLIQGGIKGAHTDTLKQLIAAAAAK
jgi:hypothetical protein